MTRSLLLILLTSLLFASCKKKINYSESEKNSIESHRFSLASIPSDAQKFNPPVSVGKKLQLLAIKTEGTWHPGTDVSLKLFWKITESFDGASPVVKQKPVDLKIVARGKLAEIPLPHPLEKIVPKSVLKNNTPLELFKKGDLFSESFVFFVPQNFLSGPPNLNIQAGSETQNQLIDTYVKNPISSVKAVSKLRLPLKILNPYPYVLDGALGDPDWQNSTKMTLRRVWQSPEDSTKHAHAENFIFSDRNSLYVGGNVVDSDVISKKADAESDFIAFDIRLGGEKSALRFLIKPDGDARAFNFNSPDENIGTRIYQVQTMTFKEQKKLVDQLKSVKINYDLELPSENGWSYELKIPLEFIPGYDFDKFQDNAEWHVNLLLHDVNGDGKIAVDSWSIFASDKSYQNLGYGTLYIVPGSSNWVKVIKY